MHKIIFSAILASFLAMPAFPAGPAIPDASISGPYPGFNSEMTSIAIADAENGRLMADHLPDLALNPASCAKILTAAAALAALGPDHRMATEFLSDAKPEGGVIETLYIKGSGDPMLVNEELDEAARGLRSRGLLRITSGIAIDNSYFDSYEFPRKGGADSRAYTAKTAATAVNFNSAEVEVRPGKRAGAPGVVTPNPPADYFRVVNKLVTGGRYKVNITLLPNRDGETVVIRGRIPASAAPQKIYRSIRNPALYAGSVIKYWLEKNGITVDGPVREAKAPVGAVALYSEKSQTLAEIVKGMNKRSLNFVAEQILKHMGAVRYGEPGSTEKGVMAIEGYLETIGIPKGSYTMENGSGLSETSRISARQLVAVLVAAYKDRKIRGALIDSFSILGVDGTTKHWHPKPGADLVGKAFVKTGTVDGVSTLAGYAQMQNGRMAAFAILANGIPRGTDMAHRAELEVVRAIIETRQ